MMREFDSAFFREHPKNIVPVSGVYVEYRRDPNGGRMPLIDMDEEMHQWCLDNDAMPYRIKLGKRFGLSRNGKPSEYDAYFETEKQAILFKLRWFDV